MKKIIAFATAILISAGVATFATDKNPGTDPRKQIAYLLNFTSIVVDNDINLLLKESREKTINITGDASAIDRVEWKIKNDVLYIRSKKGSLKDKVKVAVDVQQLEKLFIKGNSSVQSLGHLHSPTLQVHLENDCFVSIKNVGQINVQNAYGIETDVQKLVGNVQLSK